MAPKKTTNNLIATHSLHEYDDENRWLLETLERKIITILSAKEKTSFHYVMASN